MYVTRYKWPALAVAGVVCKTNLPSNTAFRGFGGPQAMVRKEDKKRQPKRPTATATKTAANVDAAALLCFQ